MLSSLGMRGGKLISVNNFSTQEHASPKNKHILNFRVMNVFVEKYILIPGFLAFLEVKVLGKVHLIFKCLLDQSR